MAWTRGAMALPVDQLALFQRGPGGADYARQIITAPRPPSDRLTFRCLLYMVENNSEQRAPRKEFTMNIS